MPAIVVEAAHLLGVGEASARLVDDQGVVGPTIPVAVHDLHEFVGTGVARVVVEHLL